MTPRVLTERELNRALLARQLLLERARMTVPRAVEQVAGLQSQYAPSPYVGLWSRVEGFRRDDLTHALERREVVQATLLRATIHIVSARDFWPFALAIREERRKAWLRARRGRTDAARIEAIAERLRSYLADGPRRRAEIPEKLDTQEWNGAALWLDLVRVPPSGTWERRRADLYALPEDWIGPPPGDVTPESGAELLVRRYLEGFGPASPADLADWAGLPGSRLAPVLGRLSLRRFRDEQGRELVDLPGAPLPDAETPAPVRFLPTWDATLLVHGRRTGILPERFRPRVFNVKTPHSGPTFLVDGQVAGMWKYARTRVELDPFEPLPHGARGSLEEEAERLSAFHS